MRINAPSVAALGVAAGLAWASGAAMASEVPTRRIGPSTASSACIGDVSSVACTVDTLLACLARANRALCVRTGAEVPDPMAPPRMLFYAIERNSVIRREQVGDDQRDLPWFQPGHTLVEIRLRACPPGQATCPDEPWEDVQIYLQRQGQAWRILHWLAPGDSDMSPQIPDSFNPRPPAP